MVDSIANRNQSDPRGAAAKEELAVAYRRLFSDPLGQLVLVDILSYSGFYSIVTASEVGSLGLAEHNGKRWVGWRIFNMLNLTPAELNELAEAVKREQLANEHGVL